MSSKFDDSISKSLRKLQEFDSKINRITDINKPDENKRRFSQAADFMKPTAIESLAREIDNSPAYRAMRASEAVMQNFDNLQIDNAMKTSELAAKSINPALESIQKTLKMNIQYLETFRQAQERTEQHYKITQPIIEQAKLIDSANAIIQAP